MTTSGARHDRVRSSEYQLWAKTRARTRFDLAVSGIVNFPLADLPVRPEDLELSGPSLYGYAPLQEALARKCGVPAECVVHATGTSMANHLVMAALLDPGDEVLIESPAYEPMVATARYLRADVKRFARRAEDNFAVRPSEVERNLSLRTRLVVLTNLHNPSSAHTDEDTLRQIGLMARAVGARVLVDEVYLDALFEHAPPTAFHLGEDFIVTSSLTKVYGLSGLRCGWILAEQALAQKLWRLNDLFGVIPAHPAERLSVAALRNLDTIAARSRTLLETNGQLLTSFLRTRDDLEYFEHRSGTVSFPRFKVGDVDDLGRLLVEKFETSVVPGRFFGMPSHMRIGISCDTEMLRGGLERLGEALDDVKR
ncbi:MAG TPA: pyridoxal phosphate-dependent aminotransferase [Pyrinomonadaceae bacterium]